MAKRGRRPLTKPLPRSAKDSGSAKKKEPNLFKLTSKEARLSIEPDTPDGGTAKEPDSAGKGRKGGASASKGDTSASKGSASKGGPKNRKGKRLSQKERQRLKQRGEEDEANPPSDEVDTTQPAAAQKAPKAESDRKASDPSLSSRANPAPRPLGDGGLESVYEDVDVLAISKPAGMLSHPSPGFWTHGTVAHALVGRVPAEMLEDRKGSKGEKDSVIPRAVVHRLDRGTSGLMVIAKTPLAERSLSEQAMFKTRGAKKRFVAILHNLPRLASASNSAAHRLYVDSPIGRDDEHPGSMAIRPLPDGRSAVSIFHLHAHCAQRGISLVSVELNTGRQHQIRVHAARVLGAPVANDETYGERSAVERLRDEFGKLGKGRPMLHSWSLEMPHPNGISFLASFPHL